MKLLIIMNNYMIWLRIIYKNNNIDASLFGQFIDYLIRYEISKIKSIKFKDNRTESVMHNMYMDDYTELREILYDKLLINLGDITHFDPNIINKLVEISGKNIIYNIINCFVVAMNNIDIALR